MVQGISNHVRTTPPSRRNTNYTSFLAFFLVLLSISPLVCGESLGTRIMLVCAQMQQVIFSFTRDVAIVIKFWHGFIDCISQA